MFADSPGVRSSAVREIPLQSMRNAETLEYPPAPRVGMDPRRGNANPPPTRNLRHTSAREFGLNLDEVNQRHTTWRLHGAEASDAKRLSHEHRRNRASHAQSATEQCLQARTSTEFGPVGMARGKVSRFGTPTPPIPQPPRHSRGSPNSDIWKMPEGRTYDIARSPDHTSGSPPIPPRVSGLPEGTPSGDKIANVSDSGGIAPSPDDASGPRLIQQEVPYVPRKRP